MTELKDSLPTAVTFVKPLSHFHPGFRDSHLHVEDAPEFLHQLVGLPDDGVVGKEMVLMASVSDSIFFHRTVLQST
jgi:hypothetical protein